MTVRIAICIPSYRRPDGLRRLLGAIGALTFHAVPQPDVTVVVVDNDARAPMRAMVASIAGDGYPWPLLYACEPVPGVASARNRALRTAPERTEYLAFIDDDEVPEPNWLDELLAVSRRFDAPIVRGPVKPVFARPPSRWMEDGRFYEEGPFHDGDAVRWVATNNTLVRTDVIDALRLTFDMRFNRTGGEDEDFFGRALRAGIPAVAAAGALVHETVPADRMRLTWLLRRWFRMGNTLTMVDRIRRPPAALALRVAKAGGRIGLGVLLLLGLPLFGLGSAVRGLCNISWGIGSLCGFIGLAPRDYGSETAP